MDSFDKQTRCYSQQQEPQQRSSCTSDVSASNQKGFLGFLLLKKRKVSGSSLTFPLRVHEEEVPAWAAPRRVQQVELCLQPLDFLRKVQIWPNSEKNQLSPEDVSVCSSGLQIAELLLPFSISENTSSLYL